MNKNILTNLLNLRAALLVVAIIGLFILYRWADNGRYQQAGVLLLDTRTGAVYQQQMQEDKQVWVEVTAPIR